MVPGQCLPGTILVSAGWCLGGVRGSGLIFALGKAGG